MVTISESSFILVHYLRECFVGSHLLRGRNTKGLNISIDFPFPVYEKIFLISRSVSSQSIGCLKYGRLNGVRFSAEAGNSLCYSLEAS